MKITTAKGVELDIGALMAQNEKIVAVGNANMNARGDVLGEGGRVVMRKEQLAAQSHNSEKTVKTISLKELTPDDFMTPTEAIERIKEFSAQIEQKADAKTQSKGNKGKLIDND